MQRSSARGVASARTAHLFVTGPGIANGRFVIDRVNYRIGQLFDWSVSMGLDKS